MNSNCIVSNLAVFALVAVALLPNMAHAQRNVTRLTPEEARQIAIDAYVYGYSLITTAVTRVQMSKIPAVETLRAPLNAFANVPRYPPGDYRGISAPNADTLYPTGEFTPMLRMYWPKDAPPSILDGSWKIPPVTKVN